MFYEILLSIIIFGICVAITPLAINKFFKESYDNRHKELNHKLHIHQLEQEKLLERLKSLKMEHDVLNEKLKNEKTNFEARKKEIILEQEKQIIQKNQNLQREYEVNQTLFELNKIYTELKNNSKVKDFFTSISRNI